VRDRSIQELVEWTKLIDEPQLARELSGHLGRSLSESNPVWTSLQVEVLQAERLETNSWCWPSTIEWGSGFLKVQSELLSVPGLESFGPTLLHGQLSPDGTRWIGVHDGWLTEYDILEQRFGARWMPSDRGQRAVVTGHFFVYTTSSSELVCYDLHRRDQVWGKEHYHKPVALNQDYLITVFPRKPGLVVRLSDGGEMLELPEDIKGVDCDGDHFVVLHPDGWQLYQWGTWELVSQQQGRFDTVVFLDKHSFLVDECIYDVTGAKISDFLLSKVAFRYKLKPPRDWYRWLHKHGLLEPSRAAGVGVWDHHLRDLEQTHQDDRLEDSEGKVGVSLGLQEVGDSAHLYLTSTRNRLHLRVTPVRPDETPGPEPTRPPEEILLALLEQVRPAVSVAAWEIAMVSEGVLQALLRDDVLGGPDRWSYAAAKLMRGETVSAEQLRTVAQRLGRDTAESVWKLLFSRPRPEEIQKELLGQLLSHPEPTELAGTLESSDFSAEVQPLLQFLQGQRDGDAEVKELCSWEQAEQVDRLNATRSESSPTAEGALREERPLNEVVEALLTHREWGERAAGAKVALEFKKLKDFSVSATVPVTLTPGSGDFILEDSYTNFTVWWDGRWWEQAVTRGALSPGGNHLACVQGLEVSLWFRGESNARWSKRVSARAPREIQLFFNHDGTRLLVTPGSTVNIYDVESGKSLGVANRHSNKLPCAVGRNKFLVDGVCHGTDDTKVPDCAQLGPADQMLLRDTGSKSWLLDGRPLPSGYLCLGFSQGGAWMEDGEQLWFLPQDGTIRRYEMKDWSSGPCQMFFAFPEVELVVRDWGIWSLSSGVCLKPPERVKQRFDSSLPFVWCSLDLRRSRLLLKHPEKSLELFRVVDTRPLAQASTATLQSRLEQAYTEEEKSLWSLAMAVHLETL
jgi:hypothetical protein